MRKPSAQSNYIEHLVGQLTFLQKQLELAREDIEFYRGKVERLELAIMSNAPAQETYVQTQVVQKPAIQNVKAGPQQPPPRVAFSDLKRQWNALTQEEQEKAVDEGWQVGKEETNAGQ